MSGPGRVSYAGAQARGSPAAQPLLLAPWCCGAHGQKSAECSQCAQLVLYRPTPQSSTIELLKWQQDMSARLADAAAVRVVRAAARLAGLGSRSAAHAYAFVHLSAVQRPLLALLAVKGWGAHTYSEEGEDLPLHWPQAHKRARLGCAAAAWPCHAGSGAHNMHLVINGQACRVGTADTS